MVRILSWVVACVLAWSATPLYAQGFRHGTAGLGIGFGSVDGISGYYKYSQHQFMQGLLAFELDDAFYLSGDVCNAYERAMPEAPAVVPYFCVGAFYAHVEGRHRGNDYFDDDVYDDVRRRRDVSVLGLRLPLGVQIFVPRMPVHFVVELVPGLTVAPGTDFFIQHLIGVRFLF